LDTSQEACASGVFELGYEAGMKALEKHLKEAK